MYVHVFTVGEPNLLCTYSVSNTIPQVFAANTTSAPLWLNPFGHHSSSQTLMRRQILEDNFISDVRTHYRWNTENKGTH